MGALIARDYVEGDRYAGDVSRLLMLGPPNQGSSAAKAQTALQWIETSQTLKTERPNALSRLSEGLGDAAIDLLPNSAFLQTLNARPRRSGVSYHILAGNGGFLPASTRQRIEQTLHSMTRNQGLFGNLIASTLRDVPQVLEELAEGTGDGAVSVQSTNLAGVRDRLILPVNHVELIRGPLFYPEPGPVACMPFLLSRLPMAMMPTP